MIKTSDINFRILTDKINVGIFVCDPKGTFIYANRALADLFGYAHPANIIERNYKEFITPEIAQEFMIEFQKSVVSGTNSKLITTEIVRPDGKTAQIEVKTMPFVKNRIFLGIQGVVLDITNRKQAEYESMYTSTHDSLTGIYNRTFFEAEINRLERGRQFPISIIVVSVGFLRNFNDTEGPEGKDKLIKRVAHRLFYAFRGDDIVARIGENDFGILIPNVDEKTIEEIITRIQDDLQQINNDNNQPVFEFFIGSCTAKKGDSLNSALRKAESIVNLKKKRSDLT